MKRAFISTFILFLALVIAPPAIPAGELAGVTMENTMQIGERSATLTGMGVRTKTFLKIKVYVAGLYMEKPSTDPAQVIGSDQARAMVMTFLYKEVKADQLQESWREGFEANTPSATQDLRERMDLFVSLFSTSALKGDRYIFSYEPAKGTTVTLKGDIKTTIPGADFASALMAIWFGEKPGDGGLKALKESILEGI